MRPLLYQLSYAATDSKFPRLRKIPKLMPPFKLFSMVSGWMQGLQLSALDLLGPVFCRHCGVSWRGMTAPFCEACVASIEWIDSACARCGLPIKNPPRAAGSGEFLPPPCGACAGQDLAFDLAACAGTHAAALRTAILEHKFRGDVGVIPFLQAALRRALRAPWLTPHLGEVGAIATVPLHPLKRWLRAGDPLVPLARDLATAFHGAQQPPRYQRLLTKTRWTRPQARLTGVARRRNLRAAFAVRRGCTVPPVVLLVDDVITTGSTASECARALKSRGARLVMVIAAARSE